MKDKYVIKFWETEEDREQGTPFEYLNTPQNLSKAIEEAREMQEKNDYTSVEVQDLENKNKTLFYKDSMEEMYFGEAISYKPFNLQETNFYKYFKEQIEMIKDSYENPSEYNLDKLENYSSKINELQNEEEEV